MLQAVVAVLLVRTEILAVIVLRLLAHLPEVPWGIVFLVRGVEGAVLVVPVCMDAGVQPFLAQPARERAVDATVVAMTTRMGNDIRRVQRPAPVGFQPEGTTPLVVHETRDNVFALVLLHPGDRGFPDEGRGAAIVVAHLPRRRQNTVKRTSD